MRRLAGGLLACLCLIAFNVHSSAFAAGPVADETGMVPGDVVIGNIVQYGPGHAGIYIGRWKDLPAELQTKYAKVFDDVIIRSRDHGLKYSYLVVDSMPGKGVRLRSFVEQFTSFKPGGAPGVLVKSLEWEARKGAAVGWPDLPPGDPRRWSVVEEGLKAALARVSYEDNHLQLETSYLLSSSSTTPYAEMGALDCIGFVHVMYWRGAEVDLDVSWWPLHTPELLYDHAKKKSMTRSMNFSAVFKETAITGLWNTSLKTVLPDPDSGINGEFAFWIELRDDKVHLGLVEPGDSVPVDELFPLQQAVVKTPGHELTLREDLDGSTLELKVAADGTLAGELKGVDDDGPFLVKISGSKKLDYQNVR